MNALLDGQWTSHPGPAMPDLPTAADGVFETLLWRDGRAEFWPEHWARFEAGCQWFKLRPTVDAEQLHRDLQRIATETPPPIAVVRYAAWRGDDGTMHWRLDLSPPRPHMAHAEFVVTRGPALPPPDPARPFKHLGRTLWTTSLHSARAAGYDEVILCDAAGRLVEGGGSNLFLVKGESLRTPELPAGALPGVMRAAVLAVARADGWNVQETIIAADELTDADEVWVTNSLIGARPVRRLDDHSYPAARPRLDALRRAWKRTYGSKL